MFPLGKNKKKRKSEIPSPPTPELCFVTEQCISLALLVQRRAIVPGAFGDAGAWLSSARLCP